MIGKCEMTAKDYKIETVGRTSQEVFETYLPAFNLTLNTSEYKVRPKIGRASEQLKLKKVIDYP